MNRLRACLYAGLALVLVTSTVRATDPIQLIRLFEQLKNPDKYFDITVEGDCRIRFKEPLFKAEDLAGLAAKPEILNPGQKAVYRYSFFTNRKCLPESKSFSIDVRTEDGQVTELIVPACLNNVVPLAALPEYLRCLSKSSIKLTTGAIVPTSESLGEIKIRQFPTLMSVQRQFPKAVVNRKDGAQLLVSRFYLNEMPKGMSCGYVGEYRVGTNVFATGQVYLGGLRFVFSDSSVGVSWLAGK